jgi:hypothetical protein
MTGKSEGVGKGCLGGSKVAENAAELGRIYKVGKVTCQRQGGVVLWGNCKAVSTDVCVGTGVDASRETKLDVYG